MAGGRARGGGVGGRKGVLGKGVVKSGVGMGESSGVVKVKWRGDRHG